MSRRSWQRRRNTLNRSTPSLTQERAQPEDDEETSALDLPSSYPSIVVRSPGSTPYQDRGHQVYPEPQVVPLMRMNKNQDQHPWKQSPQHRRPGLRDKKPPQVDPSDKQRKPGQKQAQDKEPDRNPVRQRQYKHW